ncbi:Zn(II)2Cys6 transcription factor [Aspergillus clavatus NRRL 1]|uniref:Fungal specific transcription factor domain protein n=1 Tax=Aspergillus clavatus (strain ATCC 1007 / CBS 513.65 / DSM 816 / NCTC 3887 / NRRL 1 / QM 1276 / 107) TaxID=344612 RepID=A1CII0_ASPCL|nr:fungal specific transcription factor domain protein [Aspergillus clavatus NRRL 1]EAW10685.1 fungal specific transcription factor domain protein [Aspergillus clavatus NRRL 1]
MSANSFLDKPLLKVSRPVAACSRCRTAKIKCDGKLPACSACERVGKASTCSGASDEFARGKERSYVASLEGYCERLEKQIAALRYRKESLSTDGTGAFRESSITSISALNNVAQSHRKEVSDIDDLVGDFGFLSVNATSRDFHGITSSTSFANLLLSLSIAEPLPKLPPQPLPSRHEITPLLRHYFDNIYTQLPFFVETSFWTSVDAVYQSGGRFAKPFDHWILRLVLATSSASTSYQPGDRDHQRALSLVTEAFKHADEVLRPGSVVGIQAILLLAQYSFFDPNHFRTWYLVGTAARAMFDLGLHQDPPLEELSIPDRLDIRRIVYHCVYCLDRAVSTVLERTLSFSEESVNVALPVVSTPLDSALAGQSDVFLHSSQSAWHMVKIRQILAAAYQNKYYYDDEASIQHTASIWSSCLKAQEWFDNAPENASGPYSVLYRLELLYTTVMILSPMHRFLGTSEYTKVLLFERCMDYIRQLHQILENPSLLPLMTYLDIQRAYQVSSRFLELLNQHFELVLNPSVPPLPHLSFDAPEPPTINAKDRVNCHARTIVCLDYIQDLLQYCLRKWGIGSCLETFQAISGPARKRLMQSPPIYLPGTGSYMNGPPMLPASGGTGYSGYDLGRYGI